MINFTDPGAPPVPSPGNASAGGSPHRSSADVSSCRTEELIGGGK